MQWWCDGECNGLPAKLVNVSRYGAMIITMAKLRIGLTVHLYLEEASTPTSVDGEVLSVSEASSGWHQVRLVFHSPCPVRFLEVAAQGFEAWLAGDESSF